jgi:hypothetical protein
VITVSLPNLTLVGGVPWLQRPGVVSCSDFMLWLGFGH